MIFDWKKWLWGDEKDPILVDAVSKPKFGASTEEIAWDIYQECKRINPIYYGYDADSVLNGFWTDGKKEAAKMAKTVWDSGYIISSIEDFWAVLEENLTERG